MISLYLERWNIKQNYAFLLKKSKRNCLILCAFDAIIYETERGTGKPQGDLKRLLRSGSGQ